MFIIPIISLLGVNHNPLADSLGVMEQRMVSTTQVLVCILKSEKRNDPEGSVRTSVDPCGSLWSSKVPLTTLGELWALQSDLIDRSTLMDDTNNHNSPRCIMESNRYIV